MLSKNLQISQSLSTEKNYLKGRPIYVKGQSYPFIDRAGNIHNGEEIYFFIGREELKIEDLKNDSR